MTSGPDELHARNFMLQWLSKEDSSTYGECRCQTLDDLVAEGLAVVTPPPLGVSADDYARVMLTESGHRAVAKLKESQ